MMVDGECTDLTLTESASDKHLTLSFKSGVYLFTHIN